MVYSFSVKVESEVPKEVSAKRAWTSWRGLLVLAVVRVAAPRFGSEKFMVVVLEG